jgi:hypothetical protein
MEKESKFEGWAVVELFGHSREVGYVTTEDFGSGALFRVEVPSLPEREETLVRPQWIAAELADVGTKIKRGATEGRTRFIGPGAVYALNPCSKDAAFSALENMTEREIKVVELVKRKSLGTHLPGEWMQRMGV